VAANWWYTLAANPWYTLGANRWYIIAREVTIETFREFVGVTGADRAGGGSGNGLSGVTGRTTGSIAHVSIAN